MSLIVNEIHILDGFKKTFIVFAADRRISNPDRSRLAEKPKLFRIPYLEAGVSFFGLAKVFPYGSGGADVDISDWLPSFTNKQNDVSELQDFAFRLKNELNRIVPSNILAANPSGFHICGYESHGYPEFWYLTNIGGMEGFKHINLSSRYADPTSDFLGRDARKEMHWDGVDPFSIDNGRMVYRNGDFRSHAFVWDELDGFFNKMLAFRDFKPLSPVQQYRRWVEFKFKVVRSFYAKFAQHATIGGPIDIFSLSKKLP